MSVASQRVPAVRTPETPPCTVHRYFAKYADSVHGAQENRKTAMDFRHHPVRPNVRDKIPNLAELGSFSDVFGKHVCAPRQVHSVQFVSDPGGVGA